MSFQANFGKDPKLGRSTCTLSKINLGLFLGVYLHILEKKGQINRLARNSDEVLLKLFRNKKDCATKTPRKSTSTSPRKKIP